MALVISLIWPSWAGNWRVMIGLGAIVPGALVVAVVFVMPESRPAWKHVAFEMRWPTPMRLDPVGLSRRSPRWLAIHGREAEARSVHGRSEILSVGSSGSVVPSRDDTFILALQKWSKTVSVSPSSVDAGAPGPRPLGAARGRDAPGDRRGEIGGAARGRDAPGLPERSGAARPELADRPAHPPRRHRDRGRAAARRPSGIEAHGSWLPLRPSRRPAPAAAPRSRNDATPPRPPAQISPTPPRRRRDAAATPTLYT